MKNKKYKIFSTIFSLICFNVYGSEEFNFNVTEIQILDNGNKFIGIKRGKIVSNDDYN